MKTMRMTAAVLLCLALGVPPTAAAQTCVAGPAAEASADRPHLGDPAADNNNGVWPGGTPAYDVRSAWVSQEDEPASGTPGTFAVNLAVAGMDDHPVGAAYYVNYTNTEWVAAKALPDGTWRFTWGVHPAAVPLLGNAYQDSGTVSGRVDTDADVITITLPTGRLPGPRRDGREVRLDMLYIRTGTAVGAPEAGHAELLNTADTSANADTCDVVLYPEAPAS